MAWYDAGAILLGIICAVFGIALAVAMVGLIVVCVGSWLSLRKPALPRNEAQTPFGTFLGDGKGWDYAGEAAVSITVEDRNGTPDPLFVARLPALLADLPRYERLAREAYDFEFYKEDLGLEGESFRLFSLSQGGDEGFTLAFGADDDAYDLGTVFVAFEGDRVVDTVLVH